MANKKQSLQKFTVALAGNPNVGKSTVFNCLTGLHQHTGNWAGKTVEDARGRYCFKGEEITLVDLPGTYSLFSHSYEEECAEDFLSFSEYNAVVVVADGNCLERNLNLVVQILQITDNVILAVNLMDEAEKNGVEINFDLLQTKLNIPIVPMSAGKKKGIEDLKKAISYICNNPIHSNEKNWFNTSIKNDIKILSAKITECVEYSDKNDYYAMRILCNNSYLEKNFFKDNKELNDFVKEISSQLYLEYGSNENFCDYMVSSVSEFADKIAVECVSTKESGYKRKNQFLDRIFMGKFTGFATMLILLLAILWITIYGANYPSQYLSSLLLGLEEKIADFLLGVGVSDFIVNVTVHGGYKVLAWVVSVMLPPMAIFFPLFTLLEDFGYLPRVAFNLDYYLKRANTCGKQALTMCMGFGCNSVGVTGCRIIDSPRERLIAIITNSFVPCNGKFPTLIAVISMFFLVGTGGFGDSILSSLLLCGVIVLGIIMTLLVSKFLSKTLLKGTPSSFTLELPPFRKPQIGKVIVRSVFDRTLFVLGRAVCVAFPAGSIIWLLANIKIGENALLLHMAEFLEPLGRMLGMDGVILTAFILGFPANEIVLPIAIMAYMQNGLLTEYSSLAQLQNLLVDNGWTITTAICVTVFMVMHWPCSTTVLTIKKETNSLKWTVASVLIPTLCGMGICFIINLLSRIVMCVF